MKNCILRVAAVLMAWPAFAVTGIWTGKGANAKWNNPENWQDGQIPGLYTDEEGVERGQTGDTANFGEIAPTAFYIIDLTGLISIGNVKIAGAGAPAYVFGNAQSSSQLLTLENNGKVTVDASNTQTQTVTQVGLVYNNGNRTFEMCNNSTVPLIYGDVWAFDARRGFYGSYANVSGTGPVVFNGRVQFDQIYDLRLNGTGEFTYHDTGTPGSAWRYSQIYFGGSSAQSVCDVNVDNFIYGMGGTWTWSRQFIFLAKNVHLYGKGALSMHCPWNTPDGTYNSQYMGVGPGSTVICDIPIASMGSSMNTRDLIIMGWDNYGSGTIYLNSTNSLTGRLRLFDDVTCCAKYVGAKASNSSIPLGQIIFEGYWKGSYSSETKTYNSYTADSAHPRTATFKYVGDSAVTINRDFVVSNLWSTSTSTTANRVSTNTVANAGGGTLTLSSKFKCCVLQETTGFKRKFATIAAIRLKAETEDINFRGSFTCSSSLPTWHLIVAGPKTVNVNGQQSNLKGYVVLESGCLQAQSPSYLSKAAGYQFAGGKLRFTANSINTSIKAQILGGANTVELTGASSQLSLSGIGNGSSMPAGSSIDFVTSTGSSVKFSDAASVSLPSSITLNGAPAKLDANGKLVDRSVSWAEAVDGNWTDKAKWTSGAVPSASDAVFITAEGPSYTVSSSGTLTHSGDITIANLSGEEQATLKGSFIFPEGASLALNQGGRWLSNSGDSVWNPSADNIAFDGGTLEFKGTASLHVSNRVDTFYRHFVIGTGFASFSENSVLDLIGKNTDSTPDVIVRGNAEGETATLELTGTPRIDADYDHKRIVAGYGVNGSIGVIDFALADGTKLSSRKNNSVNGWSIGASRGTGILNVRSGIINTSNPGFAVGCVYAPRDPASQGAGLFPTGIVNQTGGTVRGGSYEAAYGSCVQGYIIGSGVSVTASGNGFTGFYNLKSGSFAPTVGLLVIGCGPYSTGYFDVTGGTFSYNPSYDHTAKYQGVTGKDTYTHPMLVAFGGGKGTFRIGGGTGSISQSLFVGGALVTDIGLTGKSYHADLVYSPAGKRACDGCFSITGGTFTVKKNCYVGVDGKGTLEIGGGNFSCVDLVLSNRTESVLRCLPTADGTADWNANASGKLIITGGAKLELDLDRVTGMNAKWLKLFGASEVVGEFADEPEIIQGSASDKTYKTFATGDVHYEHNGEKGVWFRLASASFTIYFR